MTALATQDALDYTVPLTKNEVRFQKFHAMNPRVFELLEWLAKKRITEGAKRISIGDLCERLRWDTTLPTYDPNSRFKVNNDYRSLYARLLIERHPEWDELIERRELRSI